MDWMNGIMVFGIGLAIRVGIPILLTILVVWGLRRLDQRWQTEAKLRRTHAEQIKSAGKIACWEVNQCEQAALAKCEAYANPGIPCWQVFRDGQGHLQERCLHCAVFREAPTPIPVSA